MAQLNACACCTCACRWAAGLSCTPQAAHSGGAQAPEQRPVSARSPPRSGPQASALCTAPAASVLTLRALQRAPLAGVLRANEPGGAGGGSTLDHGVEVDLMGGWQEGREGGGAEGQVGGQEGVRAPRGRAGLSHAVTLPVHPPQALLPQPCPVLPALKGPSHAASIGRCSTAVDHDVRRPTCPAPPRPVSRSCWRSCPPPATAPLCAGTTPRRWRR